MCHINKTKMVDFFNEKVKNSKCPLCESDDWLISETLYGLVNLDIGNHMIYNPVVAIACNNCGNTILFQADKTGALIDNDDEDNSIE